MIALLAGIAGIIVIPMWMPLFEVNEQIRHA
jgi:type II secretory pathway component PulF